MKNNSALFYTCSLIEFIGRKQKLKRSQLVELMGRKAIDRIYRYADVLHCEPIEKTADDFITNLNIQAGTFDNVAACRYTVPDYWTIGEVYERLIEDVSGDDTEHVIDRLMEVYTSWIDAVISNYNTDFYYQSREYICLCYLEGKICA
ncbi:hypothetical protein [Pseudoflavonifractor sp. An184]|uniref:hypothetical protein n=1 Tax=Pseudoflavonifractor sp. An184 TaxID=1965576 RepID=UPI000B38503E|nr:hypothetical protein [Pseudoflavonifractor sp. An184]OUP53279.1 hypothetical protein B5F19_12480 [Pseudoflavonifractor sp. An184]